MEYSNYYVPLSLDKDIWQFDVQMVLLDKMYEIQLTDEEIPRLNYVLLKNDKVFPEDDFKHFKQTLIKILMPTLNKFHNVDFGYDFWFRLFSFWMDSFFYNVYDKISDLMNLVSKYPSSTFVSSCAAGYDYRNCFLPSQYSEIDFNANLFCDLAKRFFGFTICTSHKTCVAKQKESNLEVRKESKLEILLKNIFSRKIFSPKKVVKKLISWMRFIYKKIIGNRIDEKKVKILIFPCWFRDGIYKAFKNRIVSVDSNFDMPVYYPVDYRFRETLSEMLEKKISLENGFSRWQTIVAQILPCYMPFAYIEAFSDYREGCERILKKYTNLKLTFAICPGRTSFYGFFLNYVKNKGVTVVGLQEGGNFGLDTFSAEEETPFCDVYYGWGKWTEDFISITTDLRICPADRIYNMYHKRPKKEEYIFYVGSALEPFVNGAYAVLRKKTNIKCIERQIEFFNQLNDIVRGNLLVRNFWVDFGYGINSILEKNVPNLNIQGNTQYSWLNRDCDSRDNSFSSTLLNCKLCVYEDIETPFTEALYCNKPFILFLDKERYNFRVENLKYLEMMESVDLIVHEADECATLINNIYNHIDEWWNAPERQKVVKIIRERFVYYSDEADADKLWINEIKQYI